MAGNETDEARQAGGTLIERPWPSTSARTAEAVGFVPTDPWPVGWSVKTAVSRQELDPRGQRPGAVRAAIDAAGW